MQVQNTDVVRKVKAKQAKLMALVGTYDIEVNITTAVAGTQIDTGFVLEQGAYQYLMFEFADNGGTTRSWTSGLVRVDKLIERFEASDQVDGYVNIFDNDYVRINLVDPATGVLNLREVGRDMGLERIDLFQFI